MKENRDTVMSVMEWRVRVVGQHSSDGMARDGLPLSDENDEKECVLIECFPAYEKLKIKKSLVNSQT